jgi:hypothetical protein
MDGDFTGVIARNTVFEAFSGLPTTRTEPAARSSPSEWPVTRPELSAALRAQKVVGPEEWALPPR